MWLSWRRSRWRRCRCHPVGVRLRLQHAQLLHDDGVPPHALLLCCGWGGQVRCSPPLGECVGDERRLTQRERATAASGVRSEAKRRRHHWGRRQQWQQHSHSAHSSSSTTSCSKRTRNEQPRRQSERKQWRVRTSTQNARARVMTERSHTGSTPSCANKERGG